MPPRPTSVTVVAWILIVTSVLGAFSTLFTINSPQVLEILAKSPVPVNIQIGISVVGLCVNTVCGFFMLRGQNWARLVYVGLAATGFVYSFITSPIKVALIPGVLVVALFAFFLFRPAATAFFTGKPSVAPPPLP